MTRDVDLLGLAASTLLIVLAVVISSAQRLGVAGSIVWAAARALAQLLAVGLALHLVVEPGRPLALSWLWVLGMIVFAAGTTARRAPEVPGAIRLGLVAYSLAVAVTLGVVLGLGVFETSSRTVVPLAGLVVGNSLGATVLVGRRIVSEFAEKRAEIEARLSLGCSNPEATAPYVRQAVRQALVPQIETTKATGIVVLPGAMVGLILAGQEPLEAVRVQAVVMYLVLGAVTTTTAVVALGLARRLLTPDGRVVRLRRTA